MGLTIWQVQGNITAIAWTVQVSFGFSTLGSEILGLKLSLKLQQSCDRPYVLVVPVQGVPAALDGHHPLLSGVLDARPPGLPRRQPARGPPSAGERTQSHDAYGVSFKSIVGSCITRADASLLVLQNVLPMLPTQELVQRLYPYHSMLGREGRTALEGVLGVSMQAHTPMYCTIVTLTILYVLTYAPLQRFELLDGRSRAASRAVVAVVPATEGRADVTLRIADEEVTFQVCAWERFDSNLSHHRHRSPC